LRKVKKELSIMRETRMEIYCVLLVFALIKNSLTLDIKCNYGNFRYLKSFDYVYSCDIEEIGCEENKKEIITNVTGTLEEGLTSNDVLVVHIGGFCNVAPIGFDKFFDNILAYTMKANKLEAIASGDLKQFPKLREFWIYNNLIEYLPANLFEHNPNIELFSFHYNRIKFIGSGFFDRVPKVYRANFLGNLCIDMEASDAEELKTLKVVVKNKCASSNGNASDRTKYKLQVDRLLFKKSKLENAIKQLTEKN